MNVADYANAVKVYEKLCAWRPQVAQFPLRLRVGDWRCYREPPRPREREYYEAARLEADKPTFTFSGASTTR